MSSISNTLVSVKVLLKNGTEVSVHEVPVKVSTIIRTEVPVSEPVHLYYYKH